MTVKRLSNWTVSFLMRLGYEIFQPMCRKTSESRDYIKGGAYL